MTCRWRLYLAGSEPSEVVGLFLDYKSQTRDLYKGIVIVVCGWRASVPGWMKPLKPRDHLVVHFQRSQVCLYFGLCSPEAHRVLLSLNSRNWVTTSLATSAKMGIVLPQFGEQTWSGHISEFQAMDLSFI